MSVYGSWAVQGIQDFTPSGLTIALGPYTVAFSACQSAVVYTVNGTTTISVPTSPTPAGVAVIPPINTGTVAVTLKFNSGDTGVHIDPAGPTIVNFDNTNPGNVPANMYLVTTASTNVLVQFL